MASRKTGGTAKAAAKGSAAKGTRAEAAEAPLAGTPAAGPGSGFRTSEMGTAPGAREGAKASSELGGVETPSTILFLMFSLLDRWW